MMFSYESLKIWVMLGGVVRLNTASENELVVFYRC